MTLHKQLKQKRSYVCCDEQYHVFHDNFSVLVVLIEYVSIFLGQFVFSSSFPTLRKILVTNGQRNGIPELCYVLKISIKFSSSQYWCICRPGVPGFTGLDWVIWIPVSTRTSGKSGKIDVDKQLSNPLIETEFKGPIL